MKNSIRGDFSIADLPPCLLCGSNHLSAPEVVPDSGSWAYTYKCLSCGALHVFSIGDRMGGQLDVIYIDNKIE